MRAGPLRRAAAGLYRRWGSYWHGEGFWLSYGVCRVALGLLFLCTAWRWGLFEADFPAWIAAQDPANYRPLGVLYLFGHSCPPAELFAACQAVLPFAIAGVILGLFSRLSLLVSTLSLLCICSLYPWAYEAAWCHWYPVTLLPALAMLLGPRSPLSLDSLLFWRSPPGPQERALARGPVLLGQLAVALIFANAALYKIYLGNRAPLAWAYSDNLRNTLILQWWKLHEEMPPWLTFVVSHAWLYKPMALGNILAQLTPLLACFLVRRPVLRALCGGAVLFEVVGIKVLMLLPALYWVVLVAFFIDWDRLWAWLARGRAPAAYPPAAPFARRHAWLRAAVAGWAFAFLAFSLFVGLVYKKQHRYTYPFTSFPMFSHIMAQRPYGEHLPYRTLGSRWVLDPELPLSEEESRTMRQCYAISWEKGSVAARTVREVKTMLERSHNVTLRRIELERAVYEVGACPDTSIRVFTSAPVVQIEQGRERTLTVRCRNRRGAGGGCILAVDAGGFTSPRYEFQYVTDDTADPRPLRGEWRDDGFHFRRPTRAEMYITVRVRDQSLAGEATYFGTTLPPE